MAFKAPVNWTDANTPTETNMGVQAHYTSVDYAGASHAANTFREMGNQVTRDTMYIRGQMMEAEERANKAISLQASIDYDRKMNALEADFATNYKGMDAVARQAKYSQDVYAIRQYMGSGLPNTQASEFFLQRTAGKAVDSDRLVQTHAAQEHRAWESGLHDADIVEAQTALATSIRVDPFDRSGTYLKKLGELADKASAKAIFLGNTSPQALHAARNDAVAAGLAQAFVQLANDKNSPAILALRDRVKKTEGGDEVMSLLAGKYRESYQVAETFVYKESIDSAALSASAVAPQTYKQEYKDPTTGKMTSRTVTIPGMFDLRQAQAQLDAQFRNKTTDKNGQVLIPTAGALEDAHRALLVRHQVVSQGYNSEVFKYASSVISAFDANIAAQGGNIQPGEAMRKAIQEDAVGAWTWITNYAPQYATRIWSQLIENSRRDASVPPTDAQMQAWQKLWADVNQPGSITEEEFKVRAAALGHPQLRMSAYKEYNATQDAIRSGNADKIGGYSIPTIALQAAVSLDKSKWPSVNSATWQDKEAIADFQNALAMTRAWAAEVLRTEKVAPSESEVAKTMQLYLTRVSIPGTGEAGQEMRLGTALISSQNGEIPAAQPERSNFLVFNWQTWGAGDQYKTAKDALLAQARDRWTRKNKKAIDEANAKQPGSGEALVKSYLEQYWLKITSKRPAGRLPGGTAPDAGLMLDGSGQFVTPAQTLPSFPLPADDIP